MSDKFSLYTQLVFIHEHALHMNECIVAGLLYSMNITKLFRYEIEF